MALRNYETARRGLQMPAILIVLVTISGLLLVAVTVLVGRRSEEVEQRRDQDENGNWDEKWEKAEKECNGWIKL